MAAHAVPYGVDARLHVSDLLQGDAQLAHELDLPQPLHVLLPVLPVAVLCVAPGGDEPLVLVEADILFCDAHLGLHFVDLHGLGPLSAFTVYLPPGGRSRGFSSFLQIFKNRLDYHTLKILFVFCFSRFSPQKVPRGCIPRAAMVYSSIQPGIFLGLPGNGKESSQCKENTSPSTQSPCPWPPWSWCPTPSP